jgi:hypothetical protein
MRMLLYMTWKLKSCKLNDCVLMPDEDAVYPHQQVLAAVLQKSNG